MRFGQKADACLKPLGWMNLVRRNAGALMRRHGGEAILIQPEFPGVGAGVQKGRPGCPRTVVAEHFFEASLEPLEVHEEARVHTCQTAPCIERQGVLVLPEGKRLLETM